MNPAQEGYPMPPYCGLPKKHGILDQMAQYELWSRRVGHFLRLNDKYGKLYCVVEALLPFLQPRYVYPGLMKKTYFPVASVVLRPQEGRDTYKWYPLPPWDPEGAGGRSTQPSWARFEYYGPSLPEIKPRPHNHAKSHDQSSRSKQPSKPGQ